MDKIKQNIDISIADLNAIARIGYWQLDTSSDTYLLDDISCEITQLPNGTTLSTKEKPPFCPTGNKWAVIQETLAKAIEQKSSFNHEVELFLSDGNSIWVLLIGKGNYDEGGNCVNVSGMVQDITIRKNSEIELFKKNEILNYTENKASLGHWKWDLKSNVITCSRNISRIIGSPDGEKITIEILTEGIHPGDKKQVQDHLKNSVESKTFTPLLHRYILEDGTERIIQVLGEPLFNKAEELTGFMCSSQDITAKKRFEDELFEKNKLFLTAQQKAHFGYWLWNLTTDLFSCSENMADALGFERNVEFTMSDLLKDIPQENQKDILDTLNKTIETKSFVEFTHPIYMHGELRHIKVTGEVYTDLEGNILTILGISQDITDQKNFENELISKNQLLGFAEQITKIGNWQWDLNTNKIKWSTNLYRIFEREDNLPIVFDIYYSYIHPEDRERVSAIIDTILESKDFERVIHRILLENGKIKTVELLAMAIRDQYGNAIEMLGTLQDVSEQRAEEMKFKGLLESAPNATLILDEGNIIQMINKQAERLFKYTPEELVGSNIDLLIPSRFDEKRAPLREAFYANPTVKTYDMGAGLHMLNKDGKEIPVQVTLGPLQIEGGLLLSVVIRDITEEKLHQENIIKAKEDLETLTQELTTQNHQLADFTQITSHNLRAPVSNLNSLLDIYKMMDNEEDQKELFKKFEIVIAHLTLTLNTLIEALTAKNHTSLERSEVSFGATLTKTKEIFTAEISNSKAIIKSNFAKVDSIRYHKIYLESIFQNLIGNALKYKSRERVPELEISSKIDNGKTILSFKDNGLGIDLEKHGHKIFGLNKVFHNHPEAKGIGLFMTKTQIEAMGGKITVSSKVDEGTTFNIHFI
ncbi:PAS domain-containing sensor histidine kinase [Zobellia barbeyronii]|uniref:histidine kinase n=1 Tax=Zobellia barbeyronii TaxID=2748009 RepID=A0ABS5WIZ7_9FLAO|nr:PAS domain S-box protein [Zobellia barbeyronii]MBT2162926.1 PAS domain S-box protein [Zobellia barbeyronii]